MPHCGKPARLSTRPDETVEEAILKLEHNGMLTETTSAIVLTGKPSPFEARMNPLVDVLALDDWAIAPLSEPERRDVLSVS
jgi:hypothetical protein